MWFIKLFQGLYETATIINANRKRSNINILITNTLALKYLFASKYSIENKAKNMIHNETEKCSLYI